MNIEIVEMEIRVWKLKRNLLLKTKGLLIVLESIGYLREKASRIKAGECDSACLGIQLMSEYDSHMWKMTRTNCHAAELYLFFPSSTHL